MFELQLICLRQVLANDCFRTWLFHSGNKGGNIMTVKLNRTKIYTNMSHSPDQFESPAHISHTSAPSIYCISLNKVSTHYQTEASTSVAYYT